MTMEMIFTRRFSMAHRFINSCSKKCMNIHGHNEFVKVHVCARTPEPLDRDINMISEFAQGKGRWHNWVDNCVDHATFLNSKDPLVEWAKEHVPDARLVLTPGDPTTEIMAAVFMAKINAFLASGGLFCKKVELEETPTNTVVFEGSAGEHLDNTEKYWWNRADDSTHDLAFA